MYTYNNFCKCENCETVMFDENPQVDAKEYADVDFPNAVCMSRDEYGYPCCPVCMTDEYLVDL